MATTITLYSSGGYNMVSSWTDTVYLTLRKDGAISVIGEIDGEDPDTGRRRKYRMDGSEVGIRSPKRLLEVLRGLESNERLEFGPVGLVNTLEELDPKWALDILKIFYKELRDAHERQEGTR